MSDGGLSERLSTLDLEAKERALRLRNEQLDQRRDEVVERAEQLLNQTAETIEQSSSDDISSDDLEPEMLSRALPVAISKSGPITKPSDEPSDTELNLEEEERPRSVIPQKLHKAAVRNRNGERKSPENTVEIEQTPFEEEEDALPKEAEIRIQRARCNAMEKRIEHLVSTQSESDRTVSEQKRKIKELEGKINKMERERDGVNRKLNAEKKQNADLLKRCKRLEAESHSVSSDLKEFKKEHRTKTESMRNAHIRLNRALEDAEKYRTLWMRHQDENRNRSQIHNEELVEVKKENRVLIKQKNELLAAFRKQLKLIDILKKQRIHLEAAKVLQFTESTFAKALDVNLEAK